MKILLDTNALVWILDQSGKPHFSGDALKVIEDSEEVYFSSVSILEIRIKTMLGKLHSESSLLNDIYNAGLKELSFKASHADGLLNFPYLSRHDPFDRMLIAQALAENLSFLTSDSLIIALGLPFIINARR